MDEGKWRKNEERIIKKDDIWCEEYGLIYIEVNVDEKR